MIVRRRYHSTFDEVADIAWEEERAMFSKNERYKSSNVNSEGPKCSNCNKFGRVVVSRCYLRDRIDTRVNQLLVRHENWGGGTVIFLAKISKEEGTLRSTV